MKKIILLLIVVLLVAASVLITIKHDTVNAEEVMKKSLNLMKKSTSYEVKGIICHQSAGEGISQSEVTTCVKMDLNDKKNIKSQMVIDVAGTETANYLIGNTMYVNVPRNGWKRAPLSMFESDSPFLTLDITELMRFAENETMESKGGKYRVVFDVSPQYFEEKDTNIVAEVDENPGSVSDVNSDTGTADENVVMRVSLDIDKDTMLVVRALQEKVHLLPSGGSFEREILTTTEYNYSNYDAPVSISPPAEALSAPYMGPKK